MSTAEVAEPGVEETEPTEGEPEPETGDVEEDGETGDVTEPEDTAVPPPTEKEIEQAQEKLAKEATRHANRLSEIMGEDAQTLATCPLCEPLMPGFLWTEHITDDRRAASLEMLGASRMLDLKQDPDTEMCDVCNGYGETLTGSPVPGKEFKLCGKCSGNGYATKEQTIAWSTMHPAATIAVGSTTLDASPQAVMAMPPIDTWGRPIGQEFYGRDPQFMTPEERARDPWSPKA